MLKNFKRQGWIVALPLLVTVATLTACANAPWGKTKVSSEPVEKSVAEVENKFKSNPDSTKLRKDLRTTKEAVALELMAQAEQARLAGEITLAKEIYSRILSFDPQNQSAHLGLSALIVEEKQNRTIDKATDLNKNNQLQEAKKEVRNVLLENPYFERAVKLNRELNEKIGNTQSQPPKLKPPFDKPITLELRDANIKAVFEALSRATGVNFILDKDIRPETKATIFIRKMPIEDAIDMVLTSNGLQKKVLSENSAAVFPNNPVKLKEYQDLMIRSFYLTNTNAKQVATMIKTMLKTRDMFIDERLNMIVIRDTPEVIRIAEKLVKANDIEDAEVMLEIEVLEVSRNRLQELGINYPNQFSVLSGTTGLTLEALRKISDAKIGVSPNPAINFKKTTGDVNLLSNPRIRVKNNEKAKILVGDKVPIVTSTAVANVGTTDSVSYIDVGLKLDVEPRITLDDFVNIKVGLEVSTLGDRTVTRNGTTVYTIGSRSATTALRLKDGETQILAGLILDDERKNTSKVPGIGDIPLLGRLFSNQENQKNKTEIVLAITPRIIGNLRLPESDVSEYWSGTENNITDKPQIQIPASGVSGAANAGQTARERLLEQRRQRALDITNQPNNLPVDQVTPPSEPIPGERETPAPVPPTTETPAPIPDASQQQPNNQNEAPPLIDPTSPSIRF